MEKGLLGIGLLRTAYRDERTADELKAVCLQRCNISHIYPVALVAVNKGVIAAKAGQKLRRRLRCHEALRSCHDLRLVQRTLKVHNTFGRQPRDRSAGLHEHEASRLCDACDRLVKCQRKPFVYTNSGAASGTKYYYRVKAVAVVNGKNVASANSSKKSLLTSLAKPSVSITTSNGKPKLTWKAVTGADKYYVYRSTDGKNFSYWDSTTKTSYTNSGAKKNTKYYYKVKAVCASNSNANSAQSSTVSIKATK